jgi:hypothetical protein
LINPDRNDFSGAGFDQAKKCRILIHHNTELSCADYFVTTVAAALKGLSHEIDLAFDDMYG